MSLLLLPYSYLYIPLKSVYMFLATWFIVALINKCCVCDYMVVFAEWKNGNLLTLNIKAALDK